MKKIILINVSKKDFRFADIKKYKKKFRIIFKEEKKIFKNMSVIAILAGLEKLNKKEIDKYPNLKIISRFGTGVDNIDLDYAKIKKISVLKTRYEPVLPTAELTISLILFIIKKLYFNVYNLKKKKWIQIQGRNLESKNIGIIGFGLIGKSVANILNKFGCKIFFCDKKKIKYKNFKQVNLYKILKISDIICLHSNYTPDQRDFICKKTLNLMKKNCVLINTSRGGFINEKDLFIHLKKNKNFFAGFDCFKKEPYSGKLLNLKNFFGTSHISSNTYESRMAMSKKSFLNIAEKI